MINQDKICREIRKNILDCIYSVGKGHLGGSLSIVELLAVLYFEKMNIDPSNPKKEGRDRLVVSKGHAGPAVYATLAERGYFDKEQLLTLNKIGTDLPSHCDMNHTVGVDMTAGSLGQGFSCAVGIAVGSKLSKDNATIYTVIGDGESQEGQIWEAAMFAAHRKLDNLIAFTDKNKLQLDGTTDDICSLENIDEKWKSFGWFVQHIDGHNTEAIGNAIDIAKQHKGQPSMIILDTVKGNGVSFVVDAGVSNHHMTISKEQYEQGLKELEG